MHLWKVRDFGSRTFRCGRTAQPIWMAICCTILIPVCRACQLFLLMQTALRKGSSAGMPSACATTEKALAVVFLTYLHTRNTDYQYSDFKHRDRMVNTRLGP